MRNMKDSGIEWIGEIPEEWNIRSIKSIIDNVKNEKNSSYDTKVLSLSINGVKIKQNLNEGMNPESYIGHQLVSEGDLVICLRDLDGPLLCGVSKYNGCLSNLYYIINFKDVNAYFLDYLFHSMDYIDILDGFSYGMRHSYNISQFGCFNIPIPTIEEQELIVDYLDNKVKEIDNIILKTKETIEEYKKYKQSVITEAVTKGLNPDVEMKDSGIEWIGNIPNEWSIDKIVNLYKQRSIKVSDKDYIALSVTKKGIVLQLENVAKTDNGDNRKLVKKGDFVINSRSDRRGSCGISSYDGSVSLINIVLEPITNINSNYYNYLFKTERFADEFYKYGHGIVDDLWSTKWDDMKYICVSIPSLEEQELISDYLDNKLKQIDKVTSKKEQLIIELEQYKKSLIYECVTGKKEVSNK